MKITDLPFTTEDLKRLDSLTQLQIFMKLPKYEVTLHHMLYTHNYYDGPISGHIRWAGGIFPYEVITSEDELYNIYCEVEDDENNPQIVPMYRGTRYYAIYHEEPEILKYEMRKSVSFNRYVKAFIKRYDKTRYSLTKKKTYAQWYEDFNKLYKKPDEDPKFEKTVCGWFTY